MQRGIAKVTIGKNGKKYYYEQLNPDADYSYWYRIREYNFNWHIECSRVGVVNKIEFNEENEVIFVDYTYDIEKWDFQTLLKHSDDKLWNNKLSQIKDQLNNDRLNSASQNEAIHNERNLRKWLFFTIAIIVVLYFLFN